MPSKKQLMKELTQEIASRCCEIEGICNSYGLPMSKITVIARAPDNDDMYTVVTNEDDAGLKAALEIAKKPPATIVD